jgi:excisionase family DNA binding protein
MVHETIPDGLLTKSEAAKLLNVHERTLDLWLQSRKIPYLKFGSARRAMVRFRRADLETFLNSHLVVAIGGSR